MDIAGALRIWINRLADAHANCKLNRESAPDGGKDCRTSSRGHSPDNLSINLELSVKMRDGGGIGLDDVKRR